ncbi:MAG: ABC transporter permease subunit [Conexivisphaerales archaeon]
MPFPSLGIIPQLLLDTAYSWIRMAFALLLSILFSWAVGIAAARNRKAERIILPTLDVLQSIPILGFFPVVLLIFVKYLPGQLGVNLAVVFLIFTSMAWNIAFAVYESVKSIPADYLDLANLERLSFWKRLTELYIPSTWARVAYNSITSWSVGLFYLVTSEIFSLGSSSYSVSHGIGVDIARYASQADWSDYASSIIVLVLAVLLTRLFFLSQFSAWAERFKLGEEARPPKRDAIYRLYSWFGTTARARLFSSISKLRASSLRPRLKINVPRQSFTDRLAKYIPLVLQALLLLFLALLLYVAALAVAGSAGALDIRHVASDEAYVVESLLVSFVRIWSVYLLTAAIAVPLGITLAKKKRLFSSSMPLLQILSAIPATALLPPIALSLGKLPLGGELTAAIVIFFGMFWYVLFNVVAGVRAMPGDVEEMATLAGIRGREAWKHIYIPASLPSFITGSITAIGGAWNTLIVAEYFTVSITGYSSAQPVTQVSIGIGKVIDLAAANGDLLLMGLSLLTMSALVITFNILVWRRLYARTTKRYVYSK